MKIITIFHMKIIIFTTVKNCSILHGRVFVMRTCCINIQQACQFMAMKAVGSSHYENTPIQYTVIFHSCKNDYFQIKKIAIFFSLFFAQNIDRGCT